MCLQKKKKKVLHFTLALDTVRLIRHEVLNWLVLGKMLTQHKGLGKKYKHECVWLQFHWERQREGERVHVCV